MKRALLVLVAAAAVAGFAPVDRERGHRVRRD